MNGRAHEGPLLPFIPSPYPDEILGSWLSRVRIENGGGAWRAFLEHVGYGRRLHSMLFDVVDYTEKLSLMLNFLGTNYERALLELSTLPYWLIFSASDTSSRLLGTKIIPTLHTKSGQEISSLKCLGLQRSLGKSFEPRYCPECILEDLEKVGQPYWHRAHQLPNVLFCHKHYCKLQIKCLVCGIKFSVQSVDILPLPRPKCQCGFRFDTASNNRIQSPQELRLIKISVGALCKGLPSWERKDVLSYLKLQLTDSESSSYGQYQRVLSESFSAETIDRRNNKHANREKLGLRFRSYLSMAGAPECCALLAALDIDLDTAIAGFRTVAKKVAHRLSLPRTKADIITIDKSREAIYRFRKLSPKGRISSQRRHYWILRLYDAVWLQKQFPETSNKPIPTIAQDRSQIKKILSSVNPLTQKVYCIAIKSAAAVRAKLRDGEWFNEQQVNSKSRMDKRGILASKTLLSERANAMRIALEKILSSEERPARIYATTLGAMVGLSISQAGAVIRSSPMLREAIVAANVDKLRRQILWAARQLSLSNGRLSKKQLGRVAGIPPATVSNEILAEVKALHYHQIVR